MPFAKCCTELTGVNDRGEIVGSYVDPETDNPRVFLFSGGRFTTIDPPIATDTLIVTGINNAGQIVGYAQSGTGDYGFLYQAGRFTHIELPFPNVLIVPTGINDNGDIVGAYYSEGAAPQGFLKRGALSYNIDVPSRQWPLGINASGKIFRGFTDARGPHLYLANPLPPGLTVVNDSLTFEPIPSTYSWNAGPCEVGADRATGELFEFVARLTVLDQATPFSDAFIKIAFLSPDRYFSVNPATVNVMNGKERLRPCPSKVRSRPCRGSISIRTDC